MPSCETRFIVILRDDEPSVSVPLTHFFENTFRRVNDEGAREIQGFEHTRVPQRIAETHGRKVCQPRSMEAVVRLKSSFHWKPSTCMAFLSLLLARNPLLLSRAWLVVSVVPSRVSLAGSLPLYADSVTRSRIGGEAESKDTVDNRGK